MLLGVRAPLGKPAWPWGIGQVAPCISSLWLLGYLCWGGLLVSLAALASAAAVVVPAACVLLLRPKCFREVAAGVHQCGTVLAAVLGTPVTRVVLEGRMRLGT